MTYLFSTSHPLLAMHRVGSWNWNLSCATGMVWGTHSLLAAQNRPQMGCRYLACTMMLGRGLLEAEEATICLLWERQMMEAFETSYVVGP